MKVQMSSLRAGLLAVVAVSAVACGSGCLFGLINKRTFPPAKRVTYRGVDHWSLPDLSGTPDLTPPSRQQGHRAFVLPS